MLARISAISVLFCLIGAVDGLSMDVSRRDMVVGAAGAMMVGLVGAADAQAADDMPPIAVIGASGRTGSLCVKACLERGIPVRALTRSGSWTSDNDRDNLELLTVAACDVKDPVALAAGVVGCRGVIYAASASKKGGKAKEIDNVGVVAAGDACLSNKVGRYVVISSTAVTRPTSLGYKFTNVLGGIMDEKRKGEDDLITAYRATPPSVSSYAIIRPGGLDEPKKNVVLGPAALEVSQGDVLAGIISRADLAEVAVETALSNASNMRNAAFELYYTDSVQPCDGRFSKLLENGDMARLHGDSYRELFRNIQPDGDYYVPA